MADKGQEITRAQELITTAAGRTQWAAAALGSGTAALGFMLVEVAQELQNDAGQK